MVKGFPRSSLAGDCCVCIHQSKQIRVCKKISATGASLFQRFAILWFEWSALSALTGGFNPEFHLVALSFCRFCRFGEAVLYGPNPESSSDWTCIPKCTLHFRAPRVCLWCYKEPSAFPVVGFTFVKSFSLDSICCWTISDWLWEAGKALLACFLIYSNKFLAQRITWTEPPQLPNP